MSWMIHLLIVLCALVACDSHNLNEAWVEGDGGIGQELESLPSGQHEQKLVLAVDGGLSIRAQIKEAAEKGGRLVIGQGDDGHLMHFKALPNDGYDESDAGPIWIRVSNVVQIGGMDELVDMRMLRHVVRFSRERHRNADANASIVLHLPHSASDELARQVLDTLIEADVSKSWVVFSDRHTLEPVSESFGKTGGAYGPVNSCLVHNCAICARGGHHDQLKVPARHVVNRPILRIREAMETNRPLIFKVGNEEKILNFHRLVEFQKLGHEIDPFRMAFSKEGMAFGDEVEVRSLEDLAEAMKFYRQGVEAAGEDPGILLYISSDADEQLVIKALKIITSQGRVKLFVDFE